MRILIAGGFGLVGGRIAKHLDQIGHQVVLGSRAATCPPNWLPRATVERFDWSNGGALQKICAGVDVVIQAAGMNTKDCTANPVAALELNGLGTARLVDAACRAGVKRFIYLSSAHVYANSLEGTITEDSCPRNLHPYATSHLAGENTVLTANHRGNIEGIVLRLSNGYGAPMHEEVNCWAVMVNELCRQAVQHRELVLQSSGLQQRDFIPIAEGCRVLEHFSSCPLGARDRGVFNVGSGISQSILEMAQFIQRRCRETLGFEPELQRKQPLANEKSEPLEYRVDRLKTIGYVMKTNHTNEIDVLLNYCQKTFSRD
jgi:UDP-glucose 4-epimerase